MSSGNHSSVIGNEQPKSQSNLRDAIQNSDELDESLIYQETCGARWMERQEARSLRAALQQMDLKSQDEEQAVFDAAKKEAEELLLQHQNNTSYTTHLRKGSHSRSLSQSARDGILRKKTRSVSGSSSGSSSRVVSDGSVKSLDSIKETTDGQVQKRKRSVQFAPEPEIAVPPSNFSRPSSQFRNPFARIRASKSTSSFEKVEIQRNPPSQSRNPLYTTNTSSLPASPEDDEAPMKDGIEIRSDDIRKATSMSLKDRSPNLPTPAITSNKPERPIVSFDKNWKPKTPPSTSNGATGPLPEKSFRSSLRSQHQAPFSAPNQHTIPTINLPDEPKPAPIPTISIQEDSSRPSIPTISFPDASSPPSIPTISLPDEPSQFMIPTINLPNQQPIPSIALPEDLSSNQPSQRPLPAPRHQAEPTRQVRYKPQTHFRPGSVGAVQCHNCAHPIAGRIVTAADVRLHPECFKCYYCAERLEHVAFYPEPDAERAERIDRIQRRRAGELVDDGPSALEDGDETKRFYCHLDFHELFSPRCKSCKTPIEGEMIYACGSHWHSGHFFCAQCGDPFDAQKPFVEKDGYAWCIDCHTHRYANKCKKCRKPLVGKFLKALGAEWHEDCFVCTACNGPFDNGQYFLKDGEDDPFCPSCEAKRLKTMMQ